MESTVALGGLMKLTLLDFPGRVACTVFTRACNFRCPFCHNAPLVDLKEDDTSLDESEFFAFIEKRKGILDGVCISGGEPLMHKNIEGFIRKIKSYGYAVKLDTNGSYPEKLGAILDEKLVDYVAMDVKSSLSKYPAVCGLEADKFENIGENIKKSIALLMKHDTEYEFRTTVVKELHSRSDFEEIGKMIEGAKRYYLQYFKDSGNVLSPGMSSPSETDMKIYLETCRRYVPNVKLRSST